MFIPKFGLAAMKVAPFVALLAMSAGYLCIASSRLGADEPAKPAAKDDKLKELLKERLATVREIAKYAAEKFQNLVGSVEPVIEANRSVLEAELELCESSKERIAVLEKYVAQAKELEDIAAQFAKSGKGLESSRLKAKAERLQAEIALERAKAKASAPASDGNSNSELQDQVDLTEKQVAIKRAAVAAAEAQKKIAAANVATAKAEVEAARATEQYREKQFKRFEQLGKQQAVDVTLVDESQNKWDVAKAHRQMAEGNVAEMESRVALEQARVEVAQLELQEAELRLKQMKARLRPQQ